MLNIYMNLNVSKLLFEIFRRYILNVKMSFDISNGFQFGENSSVFVVFG